jgi:hypothetical protein
MPLHQLGAGGRGAGGGQGEPEPTEGSLGPALLTALCHNARLQPLPRHPTVLMPSQGHSSPGRRAARARTALGPGTGRAACVTHYQGPRWPHPCSSDNQSPLPIRAPKPTAGRGVGKQDSLPLL